MAEAVGVQVVDALAAGADLLAAAATAAETARERLGGPGGPPDLVCAFVSGGGATPDEVGAALESVARVTEAAATLGCSAAGVVGDGTAVEGGAAVSVWAARLPAARLRTFHLESMPGSEGLTVVGMPSLEADDRVVVLLADPFSFPVDGFVGSAPDVLGGVPLVGAVASGAAAAGDARLLVDGAVRPRGAVGVVLGAAPHRLRVAAAVSQGCRPVGPDMTVTAADGTVLRTLAGAPAQSRLAEVVAALAPEDQALVSAGPLLLGVAVDEYVDEHRRGNFLVREAVPVDDGSGGLLTTDVVAVGRTVRLQVRDPVAAHDDLEAGMRLVHAGAGRDAARGALLFAGRGRGDGFFPAAGHDVEVVRRVLGVRAVAGCLGAGEIGPVGGRTYLHGWTATVLALGGGS